MIEITIKLPVSEVNKMPSIAVFDPVNPNSVRTRLSEDELKKMPVNGHNLETLRAFSKLSHQDKIDQLGIATELLAEGMAKYNKSALKSVMFTKLQNKKQPKYEV